MQSDSQKGSETGTPLILTRTLAILPSDILTSVIEIPIDKVFRKIIIRPCTSTIDSLILNPIIKIVGNLEGPFFIFGNPTSRGIKSGTRLNIELLIITKLILSLTKSRIKSGTRTKILTFGTFGLSLLTFEVGIGFDVRLFRLEVLNTLLNLIQFRETKLFVIDLTSLLPITDDFITLSIGPLAFQIGLTQRLNGSKMLFSFS